MGSIERRHRHLIDTRFTMSQHASFPNFFWDYAVMMAAYIYNRNPSLVLNGISLTEAFLGVKPEQK